MDLDIFYSVLKSATRFSSKLQTFAVLSSLSDLNAPNLGKVIEDYGKPYFYSRKWEKSSYNTSEIQFEYPGLFVIEIGKRYAFDQHQETKVDVTLDICVVDQWKDGLLIPEIERDTSLLLQQVIQYVKVVEVFDIDGKTYYLHPEYVRYLQDNNKVGVVKSLFSETSHYQHSVRSIFSSIKGYSIALGSDMLYGSSIQISLSEYTPCVYDHNWYVPEGILKDLYHDCR